MSRICFDRPVWSALKAFLWTVKTQDAKRGIEPLDLLVVSGIGLEEDGHDPKAPPIPSKGDPFVKHAIKQHNIHNLAHQKNLFAWLSLFLALTVLTLSLFLFNKKERLVIVPPVVEKEFWVDKYTVSTSYLEQFGVFIGQLVLGKSVQSAPSQRAILLRHTSPSYAGPLRRKLIEEEGFLKKQNASYVFFPSQVRVDPIQMEVHLTGERIAYSGGVQVSLNKEHYILSFSYVSGRLLLTGISSQDGVE